MFWELRTWKQSLLDKLDYGILDETEWHAFISAAEVDGCSAMAADMKNRMDHYEKAEGGRGAE